MKKDVKIEREFLNLAYACHGALVRTKVHEVSYSITIHDCERYVRLHGDFSNNEGYENTLHKVDTLIAVLQKTKQNIIEARAKFVEKKAKEKEAKKKRLRKLPTIKPMPEPEA